MIVSQRSTNRECITRQMMAGPCWIPGANADMLFTMQASAGQCRKALGSTSRHRHTLWHARTRLQLLPGQTCNYLQKHFRTHEVSSHHLPVHHRQHDHDLCNLCKATKPMHKARRLTTTQLVTRDSLDTADVHSIACACTDLHAKSAVLVSWGIRKPSTRLD